MIATLLRLVLRQRFLSIVMGLALVGLGLWAFTQLSIEAYPDISDTQVVVITLYPGHAAEEIEQQVSVPIERALNSVPNLIARRSRTIFGLSVVELTFEYGTNDYFARQVVLEKLRNATLPDGVTPTLGPMSTPIGELYKYTLDGPGYDSRQLREIEDWVIEPRLLQVPGVTDITPICVRDGGRVHIGSAPGPGIFAIGGKTDRFEGIVLMRRGETPTLVLQGVHEAVDELNATALPAGIKLVPIYDRTDLVNNTLHTVTHTLIEGLVIVVAVLFLFLGSVRAALLTAITIPLSLSYAFICMSFSGIPANLLSLGALDFSIIVDGPLIMVAHIVPALRVRRQLGHSEGRLD